MIAWKIRRSFCRESPCTHSPFLVAARFSISVDCLSSLRRIDTRRSAMKSELTAYGASSTSSLRLNHPAVLIIDDDVTGCEILTMALQVAGCHAVMAVSGSEGIAIARSHSFDLVVVDLQLPDMHGLELVRTLCTDTFELRFVVVSGFLSTQVTVEAMRLGAIDVIEKPLDSDHLMAIVRAASAHAPGIPPTPARVEWPMPVPPPSPVRPRSNAERWAVYAFRACECDGDLKTLEDWASFLGVSYSTLCETCRLVGMRPHNARDLVRLLRAVVKSRQERCRPAVLLDVSDRRTLKVLLTRAGLTEDARGDSVSLEALFACQRFVRNDNEALLILRQLLAVPKRKI